MKNDKMVSSLGLLFSPLYPGLGAGEACNPAKKKSQKKLVFFVVVVLLSQRTGKGAAWQERNLFDNNCPAPTSQKKQNQNHNVPLLALSTEAKCEA